VKIECTWSSILWVMRLIVLLGMIFFVGWNSMCMWLGSGLVMCCVCRVRVVFSNVAVCMLWL